MVSSRIISNRTTNPAMVLEAMKRTMSSTMKLLRERYVSDLFAKLCKKKIGTNAVENHCKRACEGLSRGHQRSVLTRIMTWKLQDTRSTLNRARRENTRVWRAEKLILREYNVFNA